MLHLIDANVLITAHNTYYATNRVPEFWSWILHKAEAGHLKMPLEVLEEVEEGTGDAEKDLLLGWLETEGVRDALLLGENASPVLVQQVIQVGYASDLNDVEQEKVGRDPFLISYAMTDPDSRCVVSNEVHKPSRQRANRKVPDVCAHVGVQCCNAVALIRALDFTTAWNG